MTANAAQNDFTFIMNCSMHSEQDSECSKCALKAVERHLWYLTEELVVLSIFSSNVTSSAKEKKQRLCNEEKKGKKLI